MTELGGGIAAPSLEDAAARQTETVGQAMPGIEIRIVDEQHRPLQPGEVGELACRSDGMMLGYFGEQHNPDLHSDANGWFYSGDLAVMDDEGYIRIVGRRRDMIIRGGQNIHAATIERHLVSTPGIREAAVVGVPDALGGESVWAFVIPEDDTQLSAAQIMARCREQLEPHEIPQEVRIVTDFPRASTGKPEKYRLRAQALEELTDDG
jgi:acyl-coenzyme A synthetase/AMP-(fatty) acid ligase